MFSSDERRREYFREYYHRRMAQYREKLGGRCVICGTHENLQFDHIDPSLKEFSISELMRYSKARAEEELSKCQLLCVDCHERKSYPTGVKVTGGHGKHSAYRNGCRCIVCVSAHRARARKWLSSKENRDKANKYKRDKRRLERLSLATTTRLENGSTP